MKLILIMMITTVALVACIPPLQPIPPIGCKASNAVLVNSGNGCYWVFIGC